MYITEKIDNETQMYKCEKCGHMEFEKTEIGKSFSIRCKGSELTQKISEYFERELSTNKVPVIGIKSMLI